MGIGRDEKRNTKVPLHLAFQAREGVAGVGVVLGGSMKGKTPLSRVSSKGGGSVGVRVHRPVVSLSAGFYNRKY